MADRMTIELHHSSGAATEAVIRTHRLLIDRPLEKGGTDQGPMGGELFLASVGGCFMSNLLAAVRAREASVEQLQVAVTGVIEPSPARFTDIELEVSGKCDDSELLAKLVDIASRGCIMVNTLRDKLDLRISIAP